MLLFFSIYKRAGPLGIALAIPSVATRVGVEAFVFVVPPVVIGFALILEVLTVFVLVVAIIQFEIIQLEIPPFLSYIHIISQGCDSVKSFSCLFPKFFLQTVVCRGVLIDILAASFIKIPRGKFIMAFIFGTLSHQTTSTEKRLRRRRSRRSIRLRSPRWFVWRLWCG